MRYTYISTLYKHFLTLLIVPAATTKKVYLLHDADDDCSDTDT